MRENDEAVEDLDAEAFMLPADAEGAYFPGIPGGTADRSTLRIRDGERTHLGKRPHYHYHRAEPSQPHQARNYESPVQSAHQQLDFIYAITECIGEGMYALDSDGKVTFMNPAAERMLGWTEAELLGKDMHQVIHFRHADGTPFPAAECPLIAVARSGVTVRIEDDVFVRKDGSLLPVAYTSSPILNEDRMSGVVLAFHDISARKQLERQKDEFLSIVSHELKTPLTSLKMLTQLTYRRLSRAGLAEAEHTQRMERAILRMERLVNDLLDSSRIESGKLALRMERCDLTVLCRRIVGEQADSVERTIIFDLPAEPVEIMADAERIEQVLVNLISNALKYSPASQPIELRLHSQGDEAMLTVSDRGGGIPSGELPHLFERFYRVPGVQVQSGSGVGLGLGLHISHEIVERHGGHIWAESAIGHGSSFFVVLPLAR